MSPRKLNEQDKQEILVLYRKPEETTSTLAERYNVSSSTISRFLKNNIPEAEYEELIKQKRQSRRSRSSAPKTAAVEPEAIAPATEPVAADLAPEPENSAPTPKLTVAPPILQKKQPTPQTPVTFVETDEEDEEDLDDVNVITLEEMLGEDMGDLDEDEDEEDDAELEDWEIGAGELPELVRGKGSPQTRGKNVEVKVLPLAEATFPKTCYLVIDRSAELITKPLKDFSDLGNIPTEEFQQETLPVFDNHRVARRFSHRSQRVIKVPDSSMLEKTCSYLKAKGITRLLLDGQVFSLPSSP